MPVSEQPRRVYRERTYRITCGRRLNGAAKKAILLLAADYNRECKRKGQHWGPLTRTTMAVLEALLSFHNFTTGACFPGYAKIAEVAKCHPDSVSVAIKALECAGILTWVHRIKRWSEQVRDAAGKVVTVSKELFTSNSYVFRAETSITETRRLVKQIDSNESLLALERKRLRQERDTINPAGDPDWLLRAQIKAHEQRHEYAKARRLEALLN